MAKRLAEWLVELRKQFTDTELSKEEARAKITVGLADRDNGEIQYHALEYIAKDVNKGTLKRR